jgi:hypothetical protein
MEIRTAIELIGEMVYFPGWEFAATDHSRRFEGSIAVKVTYPSVETNRVEAYAGYSVVNKPYATFPIMVHGMRAEDLYYALSIVLMKINEHEMREALRIKPSYWAPFHPHHIDGIRRWNKSRKHSKQWELQLNDLQFGLA